MDSRLRALPFTSALPSRPGASICLWLVSATTALGASGGWTPNVPMLEPSPLLLWDSTWTLRTGGGYRDNPSIAHTFREPSGFASTGVDWMLIRPPTDGNLFYLFFTGDDRRYLHAPAVPLEETFITSTQWTHSSPGGWSTGIGLTHFYADQVFDLSSDNNGFGTARARGHTLILKPVTKHETNGWSVELEPAVSLQYFGQPLDNYREFAPRMKLSRNYGYKSSIDVSVGAGRRFYDTTRLLTADGVAVAGTHEQLSTKFAEIQWRHWWDEGHQWRTTLRTQASRNEDNGSGYFDYDRWAGYAQLQFTRGRWQVEAIGRVARYEYPIQLSGSTAEDPRHRDEITAELKAGFGWTKHLKSVASAEWQRSVANTAFDDFSVTTFQTGLEWEF